MKLKSMKQFKFFNFVNFFKFLFKLILKHDFKNNTALHAGILKIMLAAALITQAVCSVPLIVAAQDFSASVKSITGDVTFKEGDSNWKPVSAGMELKEGSYIMTAFESGCSLEFKDKSVLEVKELSKIQISQFALQAKNVKANVSLFNGKVKATVHRDIDTKTEFKVKTPVSTISVRGTEEEIYYSPGFGSQVQNISGVVEVMNYIGQKQLLAKGDNTEVNKENKAPKPVSHKASKTKKEFVKNAAATEEEEEFKSNVNIPAFDQISDMLRDLSEISREKEAHPVTKILINW